MFISIDAISQSVGISTAVIVPDPDALLELDATDKGLLIPRMNSTQRSNYTTNANSGGGLGASEAGMTIFNTSTNLYNYWDGAAWVVIQTVGGTTGAYIDNQNALDQAADFRIAGDGTVKGALGIGAQAALGTSRLLVHDASGTAGELQLLVRDNASLPILSVQDVGRVGIGTAAPGAALEIRGVAGGPTFSERITKESNVANELVGIGFGSQQSSSVVKSGIVHERISANGTGKLHFLVDNSVDANDVATSETRMTIIEDGNVGIGTTSPTSKLYVSGGRVEVDYSNDASATPGSGVFEIANAMRFDDNEIITNAGAVLHLNVDNGGDVRMDGTTLAVDASANNVGIGTTGPLNKLHVAGGARVTSLSGTGTRAVYADPDGDFTATAPGTGTIGYWTRTGTLLSPINIGDNVGIGTASPTQKLHVEGNLRLGAGGIIDDDATSQGTSDDWLRLNGYIEMRSNTDSYGIVLRDKDASSYFGITSRDGWCYLTDNSTYGNYFLRGNGANTYFRGDVFIYGDDLYSDNGSLRVNAEDNMHFSIDYNNNDADTRYFSFRKNDEENGANDTELMRILENGNVGIGITTPSAALEVYGSSKEIEISNTSETDIGIIFNDAQATGSQYAEITYNSGSGNDFSFRNGSATPRMVIESNGEVGIGTANPTYRLHVSGRLKTTGINETSDLRLKKDVNQIDGALENVLQMRGVTYNWRTEEFPEMGLNDDVQHGLIAQELEEIIPDLVLTDQEGYKSIEYTHLVPVLIEALKEQNRIIEGQALDISDLKSQASITQKQLRELINQVNGVSLAE